MHLESWFDSNTARPDDTAGSGYVWWCHAAQKGCLTTRGRRIKTEGSNPSVGFAFGQIFPDSSIGRAFDC